MYALYLARGLAEEISEGVRARCVPAFVPHSTTLHTSSYSNRLRKEHPHPFTSDTRLPAALYLSLPVTTVLYYLYYGYALCTYFIYIIRVIIRRFIQYS